MCGVNVRGLLCGTSVECIESIKAIESIESVESPDSIESVESIQSVEPIESIVWYARISKNCVSHVRKCEFDV